MLYKTCRYRNWTVHWFFGENDFLYFTLDRLGADEDDLDRIRSLVTLKNSGFTFSSRGSPSYTFPHRQTVRRCTTPLSMRLDI